LYQQHQRILERAAESVLARCSGSPRDYEGAGISKEDLIQVGAEKWLRVVGDWDSADGPDLRRFVARACRNAMLDYVLHQYRRAKRQVAEDAAAELADDDSVIGEDCIDMAEVNALPSIERDVVMRTLGLVEGADGNVTGTEATPPGRTSMPDLTPRERSAIRETIRPIISRTEG
jgi:DNA-directed RNA polymerase specialized sigma24 family protein